MAASCAARAQNEYHFAFSRGSIKLTSIMSPPQSRLFSVQNISGAGRGVVATQCISAETVIHTSKSPAGHVIFRPYRREVCAQCFEYDRGRTLPVRDSNTGKVFCSRRCEEIWVEWHGQLGISAWAALHTFVQRKSKAIADVSVMPSDAIKPAPLAIGKAWMAADECAHECFTARKEQKVSVKAMSSRWSATIDPDILSFFLAGILSHHRDPLRWQDDVLSLAMDETPYRSDQDLDLHCKSFVQLAMILPEDLLSSTTSFVCQKMVAAGGHNAFGIRSGSTDGEEYMGYGIYPSASYFNHSCNPNISKCRRGRTWEFKTARKVEKGEECCISYLGGDEKHLRVSQRRKRLKEVWQFDCACTLCTVEDAKDSMPCCEDYGPS